MRSYYGVPGYSAKLASYMQGVLGGHPGIILGCPQLLYMVY